MTEMDYHQSMNRIILFFLLAITIGMPGCAVRKNRAMTVAAVEAPQPASTTNNRENGSPVSVAPGPREAIIQIGDDLEVIVAEDHSFNGIYEVRLGGYFILPAVGRINAAGLPLKEVQANVIRTLEETQLAHATVKVNKIGESYTGRGR